MTVIILSSKRRRPSAIVSKAVFFGHWHFCTYVIKFLHLVPYKLYFLLLTLICIKISFEIGNTAPLSIFPFGRNVLC